MVKKIILTGGGTAGHVMPNIALLDYLKKDFDEIHYIGSINGIERKILHDYSFVKYHPITTVKFLRKFTLKNFKIPFLLYKSVQQCKKLIDEIKPNVIFSKGGFVAVPVVLVGAKKNISIIAHESDYTMGLANKIIYKKCKVMCFSFLDCCKKYKTKGVYTGSPIRKSLLNGNKINVINKYKLCKELPTILIIGGSLGAKVINSAVFPLEKTLTKKFNIIHIVGQGNINNNIKSKNYIQIEFINKIEDYFDLADIIISRAGSNAIFEFLELNKPMLLIPLPKEESRGDQILNARFFENNGYAKILYQENLSPRILYDEVLNLYSNRNFYIKNMKSYKNSNCVKTIAEIIKKHSQF